MKKTINLHEFRNEFDEYGRSEQFSYKGLEVLFDHLEDLGDDLGEEIELDVIGICCEFTEYENMEELQQNYNDIETMEDLEDNTYVFMTGDESFIIQDY